MPRTRRLTAAAVAVAALSVLATACTGSASNTASDDPNKDVTLNFWHGWSAPSEIKAIEDNIARFQKAHPNIKVDVTGNMTDDKINQALRAGGDKAPDVVASFTTDSVGKFCNTGAFADLNPFLKKSGIDKTRVFPKPLMEYTQFNGNQCTLPLLNDAYGLVYNKTAFDAAGITEPPKTWSQFEAAAQKLTIAKGDSYEQLGIMPTYHGYETAPSAWPPSGTRRTSAPTASPTWPRTPPSRRCSRRRRTWSPSSAATRSWRSSATPSVTSGARSTPSTWAWWPCRSTASGGRPWRRRRV